MRLILCQILNCCTFPSVLSFASAARDEYIIWIWRLMRSATGLLSLPLSPQTSTTASPSHVRMEELASTRLIPSSAFACRAMGETCVRKVRRGAPQSNRRRIICEAVQEELSCVAYLCEMKLDCVAIWFIIMLALLLLIYLPCQKKCSLLYCGNDPNPNP